MKNGNLLWLATIFLSSIFLLTNGCKKDETEQSTLTSFNEKSEYFEKVADIFNSTYETSSFEEAVSLIIHEIDNNNAINNSGLSEDSISIWWQTQDNVLFLLQLKVLDSYVDSLDNDFLEKSKVIDKSTLTEILPHNNKALLLSPSYYDWAPYAIPSTEERKDINYYFKQKLENKNFIVDYIRNETPQQQNISLDNYMNWDEYGIISFSGHGAVAGNIFGITSGVKVTPAFEEQHSQKFLNNEFMWTGKAKDGSNKYVALTNIFFRNQYPNYLDNTFILMSACKSQKNSILSLDLVKIGGNSAYWGWTNNMTPLAGAWRNTRYLIDQMLLGKTSGQTQSLMVENNRHRHILLPQMKYTYLEMPPQSSQDFVLTETGDHNILLIDDFENYNINSFPSEGGWVIRYNGAGNSYQHITDQYQNSGNKSFRLHGVSNWDARIINELSDTPSQVYFEVSFFSENINHNGSFGLHNPNVGTWGSGKIGVGFNNGFITVAGTEIMEYNPDIWNTVKVKADMINNKFSVWVNNVEYVTNQDYNYPDFQYTHFQLTGRNNSANNIVFYDDVKVWVE